MEKYLTHSQEIEKAFCSWYSIPLEKNLDGYDDLKNGKLLMRLLALM